MNEILESLTKKLNACGIHHLRQLGRAVGVYSPTNKKKSDLIADILAIATNRADPVELSHRGAPPKSEEYDKLLLAEVERCRNYFIGHAIIQSDDCQSPVATVSVASPAGDEDEQVFSGILENDDKYWFIRTHDMNVSDDDVFIHTSFISRFKLCTGDFIVCKARTSSSAECPAVTHIVSVNGASPDSLSRVPFKSLTPCYPKERLALEHSGCSLTERAIDLFSPIGKGQRSLIVSSPKSGKTTLLKHIAGAITKNHPEVRLIIALIDARPEEVTDFKHAFPDAVFACSTFDKGDANHIRTANLAVEHAKRIVESGKDAVVLLDGMTRLARASSNCSAGSVKLSDGGLYARALVEPKRLFGAARNTEEGGSLTMIATVNVGTCSDNIIYGEFRSACNMEIVLGDDAAAEVMFPAISLASSCTMKEELLLSSDELSASRAVRAALSRGLKASDILNAMSGTEDNSTFVANSKQILENFAEKF